MKLLSKLTFTAAVALCTVVLHAQSTFGTISGVITDPAASVINGASVTATNQSTGAIRKVTTGSDGFYRLVNIEPGEYTVAATSTNFAISEKKNVTVPAREEVRVDMKLQLASAASTTIEVTASSVVSEVLTNSDSKSGETINSLALNFRATNNPSPITVANLAPGVNSDAGGNITIAGQLPNATSFSLDGVATQLPRFGGPTKDLFPSVEGIAEFRVNSAGNSAEYAQPTDLTVISKSGTNAFHGGGFWYLQRKDFNSEDQISHQVSAGDANTFGMSIGGPLLLPKIYNGANKTFFYFDYEGVRLDQNTVIQSFTPPGSWRTGNFTGSGATVTDPLTGGQPFANNAIPASRISSVSAKALPLFFPNETLQGNALGAPNLVSLFPGSYSVNGFDGRMDHNFSANHRVWGRVTQKTLSNLGTDSTTGDTVYNPAMGQFTTGTDVWNVAVSYNWIIKPTMTNDLTFGYSRADYIYSYPQAAQGDAIVKQIGLQGIPGTTANGLGGVPVFYVGDLLGGATNQYGHPRAIKNNTIQISDSMSWIKGRHTFKFGGEFRKLHYQDNITFLNGDEYGDYFFTGDFTTGGGTKNSNVHSFADFLLGYVADSNLAKNGPDGKPFGYHYGFFATDTWRILPNFSLTIGLRYELNTPFDDETHQLGNFDRNYPGGRMVVQGMQGLALVDPTWKAAVKVPFVLNSDVGLPITLRHMDKGNIQPRLGFSWSPKNNTKTVVRASGGMYSVPVLGAVLYSLLGVNTSFFAEYPSSATNIRTFPNPFTGNAADPGYPSYRRANSFDLKDPKVIQWNFAIDQDLGWSTLARVSYTGSHTYNLIYSPDLNQVAPNTVGYAALTATPALRAKNLKYPNFSEVLTRDNGPSSKYQAVTLEINKRFSKSLSFSNNYTLAHNITNALGTAPNGATPVGGQIDNGGNVQNYYDIKNDYGNAYYTPRHRFVNTFVYNLPFGRGQKFMNSVNQATNLLVGGWGVTGVTLAQTGSFLTPFYSSGTSDSSGTNPSQRSVKQQRPDCISGQSGYLSNPSIDQYFNRAAYAIPGKNIGRYGTCGTGILEGPGTGTFSLSAGKTFQIKERLGFRYEAQFANLFNFLNKDNPNMNVGSSSFGRITQSQQSQQAGPRTIQMMLRLIF